MSTLEMFDKIAISAKSHVLLHELLDENPRLNEIMRSSRSATDALVRVKDWVLAVLKSSPAALRFYRKEKKWREQFSKLSWKDYAAVRILDYIDHAGREFVDQNEHGEITVSNPIEMIWLAVNRGTGGAKPDFFKDMLELFRQFAGRTERKFPSAKKVRQWMARHPSGLDPRVVELRNENRDRIIHVIIDLMDSGEKSDSKFKFEPGMSREQKYLKVLEWWNDNLFHLRFAARSPRVLNLMLGESLDPDTVSLLERAKESGIPFFVNPYYASLLNVRTPDFAIASDLAVRDYVIYSISLVEEFGQIVAWEKEDKIEEGKPNAAGWLLPPGGNVHRRYPDAAILIPNTKGRACGGLCTSCQRMYNFQKGKLNFDLEKLAPRKAWKDKLVELMDYFENDAQLRDILITGGDALMNTDKSLTRILDAVYDMAIRKKERNKQRKNGEKYAEIQRVRLGTRLPAYLPQRITPALRDILSAFREKALRIGITQFVVQAHFESAMEITPEVKRGIELLQEAGWLVVNQHVFTAASSRRGHTAKLRKVMSELGVLPYYTFSVKGYMENQHLFSTAARILQEAEEEKVFGRISSQLTRDICEVAQSPENAVNVLGRAMKKEKLPFLATDRNISNLPGVGKSLAFRVIGITRYGQRILEFEHDGSRLHSPIIKQMGEVVFIESKSIPEYLEQIEEMGGDPEEYASLYGYSVGYTESRFQIYEYPEYDFEITDTMTNLEL
ncbi:MAG: KamA family protein [Deltaproteobacteria bacterium]|nr:KamA family protein [Deltaproteobacteria bacterium]MBN2671461.1 KamA family protein [Deltaproteobacteria bacterium]